MINIIERILKRPEKLTPEEFAESFPFHDNLYKPDDKLKVNLFTRDGIHWMLIDAKTKEIILKDFEIQFNEIKDDPILINKIEETMKKFGVAEEKIVEMEMAA